MLVAYVNAETSNRDMPRLNKNATGRKGELLFLEIRKKCADVGRKSPDCGYMWVNFLIYHLVFTLEEKILKIFPCGAVLLCVVDEMFTLIPTKLPCLKKFVVVQLKWRRLVAFLLHNFS